MIIWPAATPAHWAQLLLLLPVLNITTSCGRREAWDGRHGPAAWWWLLGLAVVASLETAHNQVPFSLRSALRSEAGKTSSGQLSRARWVSGFQGCELKGRPSEGGRSGLGVIRRDSRSRTRTLVGAVGVGWGLAAQGSPGGCEQTSR